MLTDTEVDELLAQALLGGYDDEAPWDAVSKLRLNGNRRIFEKAIAWCHSPHPRHRARGADILCQLRSPIKPETESGSRMVGDPIFVAESFLLLSQMLIGEGDEQVLSSVLHGLGHLGQEGAVPLVTPFSTHTSDEIRFAATCALGSYPGINNGDAVTSLMKLAQDTNAEVRDWAMFAPASQSDADSAELREFFVQGLDDSSAEVREEAVAGLAKRKDPRAVLPLLHLLESGSYFVHHEYDFMALLKSSDPPTVGT